MFTPVFTLLLTVWWLGEPLTPRKVAGISLAAAGTVLVLTAQYDMTAIPAGNAGGVALLLGGSFAWSAYTVYGKALVRRYSALETATYSTVLATLMLAVLVPLELGIRNVILAVIPVTPAVAVGYPTSACYPRRRRGTSGTRALSS